MNIIKFFGFIFLIIIGLVMVVSSPSEEEVKHTTEADLKGYNEAIKKREYCKARDHALNLEAYYDTVYSDSSYYRRIHWQLVSDRLLDQCREENRGNQ